MPLIINGKTYYRTKEVCELAGISKATLLRWIKEDKVNDAYYRDKRGWRLFTKQQVTGLKQNVNTVIKI